MEMGEDPWIEDSHYVPKEIWSSILQHIQNPAIDLRLVCRDFDSVYGQHRLISWKFNPKNYPLFQKEKGEKWIEQALAKVSRLSFINYIDPSKVNDGIPEDEWENENIFLSQEDFKYISEKAINLEEMIINNISCMSRYLNFQAPYVSSLVSFQFDYDGHVFTEIPAGEFIGCAQFSNLKNINIHADIFSYRGKVTDGFSSLTNLEKLTLQNVWRDELWSSCATDLFDSLTCFKKLDTLVIHGIPTFISLNNLSPLTSLTGLELHFTDLIVVNQDDLPTLLNSLSNLKRATIDYDEECDVYLMSELHRGEKPLKENKVYIEKYDDVLKYKILHQKEIVKGVLDIKIKGELTPEILVSLKPKILYETSKRGYTQYKLDDSHIFSIDRRSLALLYPQLKEIKGNMIVDTALTNQGGSVASV
jgi:hypothetical protein